MDTAFESFFLILGRCLYVRVRIRACACVCEVHSAKKRSDNRSGVLILFLNLDYEFLSAVFM